MDIKKTSFAIKVTCKCGGCIACTMIYGGISIDEEFTDIMAEAIINGGGIEIVNTKQSAIILDGCKCKIEIKQTNNGNNNRL